MSGTTLKGLSDQFLNAMYSIRHLLHFGILPILLCFSSQVFAQGIDNPGRQANASVIEQVESFLEHFVDPQKTPEQQAALFSPDVQYYGRGEVSRAEIVQDIKYFTRRWPTRFYRLASIHYITPDPASDRVFVSYEITYRVANTRKAASGKAYYGAVIANLSSSPKIEWIKETVVN